MQIRLANFIRHTPEGAQAAEILRKCVHCGFCLATCPTYRLLGDELDGPRGRIYLIKQMLEGETPTAKTQLHLDRCLTCRACETACPSGVSYGHLLDIGRDIVASRTQRPWYERIKRRLLRGLIADRTIFAILLKFARGLKPLLPQVLKRKVPALPVIRATAWPSSIHTRRMLVLEGCVQTSLSPNTNAAAARVLNRIGITLLRVEGGGCCGAISYHLDAQRESLGYMRRNIDAWWPHIEQGVEAIVITATGCGVMVADYGRLLVHDMEYAEKARRVSALAKDIGEIIGTEKEALKPLLTPRTGRRLAFHSPCSLQHGLKQSEEVEALLRDLNFELTAVPNAHLCCGSAGTYSVLQPKLANQLLQEKIAALESGTPTAIVTANIGCQSHLQTATKLQVAHWIEELDMRLA